MLVSALNLGAKVKIFFGFKAGLPSSSFLLLSCDSNGALQLAEKILASL